MEDYRYQFTVIIPCMQEYKNLSELLPYLTDTLATESCEIIISNAVHDASVEKLCNALSSDQTPITFTVSPTMGRACQLAHGAALANGKILYFLHADVRPPADVCHIILREIEKGYDMGCFTMKFDSSSTLLRFNSYFSHFNGVFVGGGDQSLFISQENYHALGGYDTDCTFMEDFEFYHRARKSLKAVLIQEPVHVSARKYENNNYLKVQVVNLITFVGYRIGIDKKKLSKFYSSQLSA